MLTEHLVRFLLYWWEDGEEQLVRPHLEYCGYSSCQILKGDRNTLLHSDKGNSHESEITSAEGVIQWARMFGLGKEALREDVLAAIRKGSVIVQRGSVFCDALSSGSQPS